MIIWHPFLIMAKVQVQVKLKVKAKAKAAILWILDLAMRV
jgi:hypothetical protein